MKLRQILSNISAIFVPSKYYGHTLRNGTFKKELYNNIYSRCIYKKNKGFDNFKYFLSICAITKNEGPYLKEWIEYHKLVGVENFYIYDNESTDETTEILKPYIDSGLVDCTYVSGRAMQLPVYQDCINKHRLDTKWLAVVDLDEFIVPVENDSIVDFLKTMKENVSQIFVGWLMYGTSGHKTKPNGLLMENYKYRILESDSSKSIIKPLMAIKPLNPHVFKMICGDTVNENGEVLGNVILPTTDNNSINKIRINHYYTKSEEEFYKRKNGGRADAKDPTLSTRSDSVLTKVNTNATVSDNVIDRFIEKVKEKI